MNVLPIFLDLCLIAVLLVMFAGLFVMGIILFAPKSSKLRKRFLFELSETEKEL